MKAFLVGLIFLVAASLFLAITVLLYPALIILGFLLRLAFMCIVVLFFIWLLGKLIIYIWENIK